VKWNPEKRVQAWSIGASAQGPKSSSERSQGENRGENRSAGKTFLKLLLADCGDSACTGPSREYVKLG
jgi:hypothetical protein